MKLETNPFYILRCSTKDSKKKIQEQATQEAFNQDEGICREAESILLNPQKRITAEIGWFPGIDDEIIRSCLNTFKEDVKRHSINLNFCEGCHPLPLSNYLAYYIEEIEQTNTWHEREIGRVFKMFCSAVAAIKLEEIATLISYDREKSKFPKDVNHSKLYELLENQKKYYYQTLHDFCKKLKPELLSKLLTINIKDITQNGKINCEWELLENLIANYEIENRQTIEKIKRQAITIFSDLNLEFCIMTENSDNADYEENLKQAQDSLKKLDSITKPIQYLEKSKGNTYEPLQRIYECLDDFGFPNDNFSNHSRKKLENYVKALQSFLPNFENLIIGYSNISDKIALITDYLNNHPSSLTKDEVDKYPEAEEQLSDDNQDEESPEWNNSGNSESERTPEQEDEFIDLTVTNKSEEMDVLEYSETKQQNTETITEITDECLEYAKLYDLKFEQQDDLIDIIPVEENSNAETNNNKNDFHITWDNQMVLIHGNILVLKITNYNSDKEFAIKLDEISGLCYGIIPAKLKYLTNFTCYQICIKHNDQDIEMVMHQDIVYNAIKDALCSRLRQQILSQTMQKLYSQKYFNINDTKVYDSGIATLMPNKIEVIFPWNKLEIINLPNETLKIRNKPEHLEICLSFRFCDTYNLFALEELLKKLYSNPSYKKLTDPYKISE